MSVGAKICGLKTKSEIDAAIENGARFIGFVTYPKSPRYISLDAIKALSDYSRGKVGRVGLFVDADDALIEETAPYLDLLQLHGDETPERVAEIKAQSGKEVIKVIPLKGQADLEAADAYLDIVDYLMFDAKPNDKAKELPGGRGVSFDWRLLTDFSAPVPWLLAGGLNPVNVAQAISLTKAPIVDVSSGVESEPGKKDNNKIKAFLDAVKEAGVS